MSDTSATTASTSGAAAPKVPARPAAEVRADIEKERTALAGSFEALRGDLDEAFDAGTRRAKDAGRKAAVVGPAVAGALAVLLVLRRLVRRRRSAA